MQSEAIDAYSQQLRESAYNEGLLETKVQRLQQQIELLKSALDFYANPEIYELQSFDKDHSLILEDKGLVARVTLKHLGVTND